jgi:hypothetical protein
MELENNIGCHYYRTEKVIIIENYLKRASHQHVVAGIIGCCSVPESKHIYDDSRNTEVPLLLKRHTYSELQDICRSP